MKLEILVVDDDLDVLAGLARGLRAAGHSVAVARDGLAALAQVRAARPDLILADVMMPGLNGYQLCRKLRGQAETAGVPVFLMSGKVDPADELWAREVGARALLPKPVALAEALPQLERVAGRDRRAPTGGERPP